MGLPAAAGAQPADGAVSVVVPTGGGRGPRGGEEPAAGIGEADRSRRRSTSAVRAISSAKTRAHVTTSSIRSTRPGCAPAADDPVRTPRPRTRSLHEVVGVGPRLHPAQRATSIPITRASPPAARSRARPSAAVSNGSTTSTTSSSAPYRAAVAATASSHAPARSIPARRGRRLHLGEVGHDVERAPRVDLPQHRDVRAVARVRSRVMGSSSSSVTIRHRGLGGVDALVAQRAVYRDAVRAEPHLDAARLARADLQVRPLGHDDLPRLQGVGHDERAGPALLLVNREPNRHAADANGTPASGRARRRAGTPPPRPCRRSRPGRGSGLRAPRRRPTLPTTAPRCRGGRSRATWAAPPPNPPPGRRRRRAPARRRTGNPRLGAPRLDQVDDVVFAM